MLWKSIFPQQELPTPLQPVPAGPGNYLIKINYLINKSTRVFPLPVLHIRVSSPQVDSIPLSKCSPTHSWCVEWNLTFFFFFPPPPPSPLLPLRKVDLKTRKPEKSENQQSRFGRKLRLVPGGNSRSRHLQGNKRWEGQLSQLVDCWWPEKQIPVTQTDPKNLLLGHALIQVLSGQCETRSLRSNPLLFLGMRGCASSIVQPPNPSGFVLLAGNLKKKMCGFGNLALTPHKKKPTSEPQIMKRQS